MSYSIFKNTMADMTYQDIEKVIKDKAIVLLPVAVIEEHGPHLPLGTDTYLTYSLLTYVQKELEVKGVNSVIAPPFYYGINLATGGFPGSFTVKVDTMKAVLKDTVECLYNWGFEKIYMINMHGDGLHCNTLLETVKEISEWCLNGKRIYDIIPEFSVERLGLRGDEPYILIQRDEPEEDMVSNQTKSSEVDDEIYLDIHAGGFETSLMLLEFEELVNKKTAEKLPSSKTTPDMLGKWQSGGQNAKEVTPLGYCGNPSNIDLTAAKEFINDFARSAADIIVQSLR